MKGIVKHKIKDNLKNILLPCIVLSGLCGIFTGALIFAFKWIANLVIKHMYFMYELARNNALHAVILILFLVLLGYLSHLILKYVPNCRGGGIPTAVTFMRGFISFNWVSNAFTLLASSLITFLGGVPLGNEGPSVQMGCAVGHGTVRFFARKKKAWDRYIMTGGACAGFAAATGTLFSGMLFALEEVHRRFSPMIFIAGMTAILTSTSTMQVLCSLVGMDSVLFHFVIEQVMPLRYFYAPIIVGLVLGFAGVGFTKLYTLINSFLEYTLKKVPYVVKVISVFVIVGILGLVSSKFLGSGHNIIDELMEGHNFYWYMLLVYLFVRAILLLFATQVGVTGGLFLPSLAFGAILGDLVGNFMVDMGILPAEFNGVIIVIGMACFLASSSRIPLTAIAFSVEAFAGLSNILPIAIGVGVSYLVVILWGSPSFTDEIVENKIKRSRKGKTVHVIDVHMPVMEGAFVIGKEARDILWPPTCAVLSVDKENIYDEMLHEGDRVHLRFKTVNVEKSLELLENLLGKSNEQLDVEYVHQQDTRYSIPEQ